MYVSLCIFSAPSPAVTSPCDQSTASPPARIVRPWELSPRKVPAQQPCCSVPAPPLYRAEDTPRPAITAARQLSLVSPAPAPLTSTPAMPSPQFYPPATSLSPVPSSSHHDSGYISDSYSTPHQVAAAAVSQSPTNSPDQSGQGPRGSRHLNRRGVQLMEQWYSHHFDHPYPSADIVQHLAKEGGLTPTQVKKWMANKRVRSFNTLSFNGSIHPKRLQRLQRQGMHPYSRPVAVIPAHPGAGGAPPAMSPQAVPVVYRVPPQWLPACPSLAVPACTVATPVHWLR